MEPINKKFALATIDPNSQYENKVPISFDFTPLPKGSFKTLNPQPVVYSKNPILRKPSPLRMINL